VKTMPQFAEPVIPDESASGCSMILCRETVKMSVPLGTRRGSNPRRT
jgi:hypothetical protein